MKTALITGLEGFTGRYVARELEQAGFRVVGLAAMDNTSSGEKVVCDICDVSALTRAIEDIKPDVVCHLAAIAFVAHGDVDTIYRTNVVGTRNLLEALANTCKPSAVVLASSANIYGNATQEILDESVPAAPANDYAVSKLAMEYVAQLWAKKLPITIIRPFNYTGVGQSRQFLVPKIIDHFARRAPLIELGNLDVIRDFSDVRTIANCYRRLIETASNRPSGKAFNTCSGIGYSLRDIINMMQEIAGYEIEVKINPAFVRADEVKKLIGSRNKLEAAIDSVPIIALRDTMEWMYMSAVASK